MNFTKYNSIENTYCKSFHKHVIMEGLHQGDFVTQEKAHGANLPSGSRMVTSGVQNELHFCLNKS